MDLYQRVGRFDVDAPVVPDRDTTFIKAVRFWAPRRWLSPETMDVEGFVTEIEEIVKTRGFITWDGQVLTSLARVGPWEACFEAISVEMALDIPERQPWGPEQGKYFGLEQPYQMADDPGPFTGSSVNTGIVEPYLAPGELIVGIVRGVTDRCFFTCPCHYDSVVYTTHHRLVCMTCGATHVVLREPLATTPRQTLTAEDWVQLFDVKGTRHHEAVDLVVVDVPEIEAASLIWSTSQWDQALQDFILRARSTPEEYEGAIRETARDPSTLLEAGWIPVAEPPSPVLQAMDASLDVDMMDTAGHALDDGASAYVAAYVEPGCDCSTPSRTCFRPSSYC
jgi:hypothetical protein